VFGERSKAQGVSIPLGSTKKEGAGVKTELNDKTSISCRPVGVGSGTLLGGIKRGYESLISIAEKKGKEGDNTSTVR